MTAEKIRKIRGLKIFRKSHPAIKKLQEELDGPEIHGHKLWFSSYFIMDYLKARPPHQQAKIMEIGCGWGLLGIYCAKKFAAAVTAVDADKHVFPYLDLHAEENQVNIVTRHQRFEKLSARSLRAQDMILGADICFWDELLEPLLSMITLAVAQKVPTIILADPGRSPFLKLARRCRKLFNAELRQCTISSPVAEEGYLLIIRTPPES
ncbi:MAG: methyltransferase [Pseudomonadales bacterium]|nr:methyltransferase [Pseudomonadales bacterium]